MANSASIDVWAPAVEVVSLLAPRLGTGPSLANRMAATVIPVNGGALVVDDVPEDGNAVILVESLDASDALASEVFAILADEGLWHVALYDSAGDPVSESRPKAA